MPTRRHSPVKVNSIPPHLCSVTTRLRILGNLPFFADISVIELEQINKSFHEQDFSKDEVVCLAGDPAEKLFVIADGSVRLLYHSLSGKEILLDLLITGEFFGAISGLGGDTYPETAQAKVPSCILVIERESFQDIIQKHPMVAVKVIEIMAKRLREANERVQLLSTLPVEGRIAQMLIKLADKFGEKREVGLLLQVPLSREEIAAMTGTTTESASRVMSQFQKEGLIQSGRGWIALRNRKGLESYTG